MVAEERDSPGPEYDYYDSIDEEEEEGGRGPVLAVVALIVLAALGGVVWVAYREGVREGQRSAPPILRAEAGGNKEVPTDQGGRVVPNQDLSVYEAARGEDREQKNETLMPQSEEPIAAPPVSAPPPAASSAPPTPQPAPQPAKEPATEAPKITTPAESEPAAVDKPTEVASLPAASGDYVLQIGAYRSREEAMQAWQRAQSKHADLLDFQTDIVAVDLGAKGTYHRLRFGPFQTRDAAASTCETLRAAKQDCLVVKR